MSCESVAIGSESVHPMADTPPANLAKHDAWRMTHFPLALTRKRKEEPVRITSKGRVTIPVDIREKAGLMPNTDVDFEFDGHVVRLVPSRVPVRMSRGARAVAWLRGTGDVAKRDSYPKTTYIAANCVGSPHYFRIDLKGTKGEVDIAFKNIGTGDLIRFLEDRKPKISNVVLNKQSIALQISGLPSFFVGDGILSAKESAMKSFEAAHQLLEFWQQNRAFFE